MQPAAAHVVAAAAFACFSLLGLVVNLSGRVSFFPCPVPLKQDKTRYHQVFQRVHTFNQRAMGDA